MAIRADNPKQLSVIGQPHRRAARISPILPSAKNQSQISYRPNNTSQQQQQLSRIIRHFTLHLSRVYVYTRPRRLIVIAGGNRILLLPFHANCFLMKRAEQLKNDLERMYICIIKLTLGSKLKTCSGLSGHSRPHLQVPAVVRYSLSCSSEPSAVLLGLQQTSINRVLYIVL